MSNLSELVAKFQFVKILSSNPQTKTIVLLGTIDSANAIISLEKTHFNVETVIQQITDIEPINNNDIYYWGMNVLQASLTAPSSKLNLVYPATERHIKKYDTQKYHLVTETPQMYREIVQPYIETMKGDRIKWVKNILFNNYEADKIAFKDDELVLLPDMKWDGTTLESLYLVCIVKREDISSIRDLNESHIDYLSKIMIKLRSKTAEYYNIKPDVLRLFVHYQPSYYHFHIHVVNVAHPGLGDGIAAGKAILLEEVIENLQWLGKDGYAAKTISYVIGENHDLWKLGFADEQAKWLTANKLL